MVIRKCGSHMTKRIHPGTHAIWQNDIFCSVNSSIEGTRLKLLSSDSTEDIISCYILPPGRFARARRAFHRSFLETLWMKVRLRCNDSGAMEENAE